MERVTAKYYVSKKGSPVLKAYIHKGVREGENFTGNFNDMTCEHSHIQNQIIVHQSTLISSKNNWLALNTGKINSEHKH